jgi:predicted RNA-binding Zn-ribbon protein involved in translation (DUF1610 family)
MPVPHREFEEARRMLVRAVAEIKGGEYMTARRYLERVLNVPARADQKANAYYWLSEISESENDKRDYLQSALGYDMSHHRARRSLAILDGRLKTTEMIDPDTFSPEISSSPQPRKGKRFECPNCGSRMIYSPDGRGLFCESCESQSQKNQANQLKEQEFVVGISTAKGHQHARTTQSFECGTCGAVFLLAPEVLSLTCPHCGSIYSIIQSEERQLISPEGIIPFQVSDHAVEQAVLDWCKSFGLDSNKVRLGNITGIYLPSWTFDVGGVIKWTGYLEYRENHPIPVRDSAAVHFDDLFVPASRPQPKYLSTLLREFRATDVKPYAPEFLSNFLAESYRISMSDAAVNTRALVFKIAKKAQREKSGLDRVQNLKFSSDGIILESFKLVLVPVWMGEATLENKRLEILVNGKTGQIYAENPPKGLDKIIDWLLE